jgi:hypothetical protein
MQRDHPHKINYIECPKYKGRPKKHVDVCRRCRWKTNCRAYHRYRQPELPFEFGKNTGTVTPRKFR